MQIGNKIKTLRMKAGLTQERFAERLGLSAQSVSKWENAVTMPDITTLPLIAEEFGVSIDELFDLTTEERCKRIENRLQLDKELPHDVFCEYEDFLKAVLAEPSERMRALNLIALLYHHRMESDSEKVSRYAREAISLAPERKESQWLLDLAEGQYVWDWNVSNHAKIIDFYKKVIKKGETEQKTALPYYYLIDNLIADHRTEEARKYIDEFEKLPSAKKFMTDVYRAHVALAEYDERTADKIIERLVDNNPDDPSVLFEAAQYYARKCDYDKAVDYYERSFSSEKKQPRFIDALQGIATICEIREDFAGAVRTYDRIIECLKGEWGLTDEVSLREAERERARLFRSVE